MVADAPPPDAAAGTPDGAEVARPLRLLIVDDQPLIRRGLAMMLATEPGIEVVGQAADGLEAVTQALAQRPDVVVMDLQMPRASGVVATRRLAAELPAARVVVLTTFDDDELVFEAIRAGAQAYLLKDASEAEVLDTIRAVHRGESRLSPAIARKVLEQFRSIAQQQHDAGRGAPPATGPGPVAPASGAGSAAGTGGEARSGAADAGAAATADSQRPGEPLTDKEARILDLIAQGRSNKQIAAAMYLAEGTVKNYVSRILDKLHAGSRYELVARVAARRG